MEPYKPRPPAPPLGNKRALGNDGGAPLVYDDERILEELEALRAWMELPDSLYFKTFAVSRGYHPNRFQEFADRNPEFACALELAKVWQECRLVNLGLWNKTNSGLTKFMLINNHGYREQSLLAQVFPAESAILPSSNNTSAELVSEATIRANEEARNRTGLT